MSHSRSDGIKNIGKSEADAEQQPTTAWEIVPPKLSPYSSYYSQVEVVVINESSTLKLSLKPSRPVQASDV